MKPKPEDVIYLGEVLENIQLKLKEAGAVTLKKVLPGARAKVLKPLTEARVMLTAVEKVMRTSGMDKRLGFVKTPNGMQPVETKPVEVAEADDA